MPKSQTKFLSYAQACKIIQDELKAKKSKKEIKSIFQYCSKNNINYNCTIKIVNNYSKPFPEVASKLLRSFGYDVEEFKGFKLK